MAVQSFCEHTRVCGTNEMVSTYKVLQQVRTDKEQNQERSSLTLMGLPNELKAHIATFLDRKSLISFTSSCKYLRKILGILFCRTFFVKRCHASSQHSMDALIEILQHPVFGSYVDTIALNTILPAAISVLRGTDRPMVTKSGIPELIETTHLSRPPIQITDKRFFASTNFNIRMRSILQLLKENNKSIKFEVNDHDLNHVLNSYGLKKLHTEPAPRRYVIGYHIIQSIIFEMTNTARVMECPVDELSVNLTTHSTGSHLSTLWMLGGAIRHALTASTPIRFHPDMVLHLAAGSGGKVESSLDYDPKAHSLSISGLNVWHELTRDELTDRNASAGLIGEVIIGGHRWRAKWLSTAAITSLELSDCSIPQVHEFCALFLPLLVNDLKQVTIRNTRLESENDWASIIDLLASGKNLEHCLFINLTSATLLESPEGLFEEPKGAEFVDVVCWEHRGADLKDGLWDLVACLRVASSVWQELSDDDDLKWRSGLGPHLVKGINEEKLAAATE